MRHPRILVLALTILAVVTSPSAARGFALDLDGAGNVLHWVTAAEDAVPYRLAAANVPFGSAGENAIHRAFATWSAVSPTLSYRFDGYAEAPVMANDGQNVVLFVYRDWPFDPGFAAITFRYFDEEDGRLLDTDIAFNAQGYAWSIGGASFDIENSATHEVGHMSGLGHSDVAEATMDARTLPRETAKRSLHADDRAAIGAVYGAHGAGRPPAESPTMAEPGVLLAATAGDASFLVASLLAVALRSRRRIPRTENRERAPSRRRAA